MAGKYLTQWEHDRLCGELLVAWERTPWTPEQRAALDQAYSEDRLVEEFIGIVSDWVGQQCAARGVTGEQAEDAALTVAMSATLP